MLLQVEGPAGDAAPSAPGPPGPRCATLLGRPRSARPEPNGDVVLSEVVSGRRRRPYALASALVRLSVPARIWRCGRGDVVRGAASGPDRRFVDDVRSVDLQGLSESAVPAGLTARVVVVP